jgi:hypothetical protein
MSTAVIQKNLTERVHRSYPSGTAQWPAGTTALAFEIWAALAVSYYIAFILELNSAANAGTGLLILVGPTQGMVLSKASPWRRLMPLSAWWRLALHRAQQ